MTSLRTALFALGLAVTPLAAMAQPQGVDTAAAIAGEYATDPQHAYIYFSYDHLGYSRPIVRWRDWTGALSWNPEATEKSSVRVTIKTASVDSGVDRFDDHLRSEGFFDAEKFPTISFVSTAVERTGPTTGVVTGDLTIKGVTKPVSLDVTLNGAANDDFFKSYRLGFSARTTINRSEFGLDNYVPLVSDAVDLVIETEFSKARPE